MSHSSAKLITVRELAEYLDVTPAALYKWIKEDRMPKPLRLGGQKGTLRWRLEEINTWLEESKDD
jgi:excisionase family DNA binding protein